MIKDTGILVRRMHDDDITAVANVHKIAFPRQTFSKEWIECFHRAYPLSQSFVAILNDEIVGFVIWTEKGGFKKEALIELEQGAIEPIHQGKGICSQLILESLAMVFKKITHRGSVLKNIIVNTRVDNTFALRICKNVLGAEIVATVSGVFQADEVYLISSDIERLIEKARLNSSARLNFLTSFFVN